MSTPRTPRTIGVIRKNAREQYRLEVVDTDEGPRLKLMLDKLRAGEPSPVRCLGQFHPSVLHDLAEGIRQAERLIGGGPPMSRIVHPLDFVPRSQRRRVEKLQDAVDRVLESDRLFFERHRDRNHRLRLAGRPEIEMLEVVHGAAQLRIAAGDRWFVVVRQIEEGTRLRHFEANAAGFETDIPEHLARGLFDHLAPPGSEMAKAEIWMWTILAKRRGTA